MIRRDELPEGKDETAWPWVVQAQVITDETRRGEW